MTKYMGVDQLYADIQQGLIMMRADANAAPPHTSSRSPTQVFVNLNHGERDCVLVHASVLIADVARSSLASHVT